MVSSLLLSAPRLLVFDLDGTLVDSARDLAGSVNAMLEQLGRTPLQPAVISSYIGDGASMLVRRALGDPEGEASDESAVSHALTLFLAHYREHKLDHTRPYQGVPEALEALRNAYPQALLAVLTNKPVLPSQQICDGLGLGPFFRVYGGNSFHTKKPDPLGLRTLIREGAAQLGADQGNMPEATVMIGDSAVDIQTARACGAHSIGCTYGFAPESLKSFPADRTAHCPADWVTLLVPEAAIAPSQAS